MSDVPGDPLAVGDEYLSDFQHDTPVRIYTDFREMIAEGPIDAVNDYTLHTLHHQIAAVAFRHGKHLLTQKPLAVSLAAGRRMCQEAEARGLVLGVLENARNRVATRALRWLFHAGSFGKLQMILMGNVAAWWAPDRIVAETPWRHRRDEAGGITLDLGVHHADIVRYVAGEVTRVQGHTALLEPRRATWDRNGRKVREMTCDAEDTYCATLVAASGVLANLFASWGGHGGKTVVGQTGTVYYGSAGRVDGLQVTWDGAAEPRDLTEWYQAESDPEQRQAHFPHGLLDPFALNQYDWLDAIRRRCPPETDGREGLRDLAVAYAILESAHAGREIDVDEVLTGTVREFQRPMDERFGI